MRYCKVCGAPLGERNTSGYCIHHYRKQNQNYKTCPECQKLFACPPSNDTVCCSRECSKQHRAKIAATAAALKVARDKLLQSPICQPDDHHHAAKEWVLQAPDGTIYRCRNLMCWCRDHADLFDGTARQAWDGISKIKYSMQGKRKNISYSWKGWRLLEYGD